MIFNTVIIYAIIIYSILKNIFKKYVYNFLNFYQRPDFIESS